MRVQAFMARKYSYSDCIINSISTQYPLIVSAATCTAADVSCCAGHELVGAGKQSDSLILDGDAWNLGATATINE